MSEKISLLVGKFMANVGGNGAASSNQNTFTVNTAVNEVAIDTATVPAWYFIFQAGAFAYNFAARDNIRLLSAGIYLPHGFSVGKTPLKMQISRYATMQNLTFVRTYIAELSGSGTDSFIEMPFANYEFALDCFCPYPDQSSNPADNCIKYLIECQINAGDVSMFGAPAGSNGQVYTPIPFMKVLHTNFLVN